MAVHIPAVLAVLVYFIVVVCVGVWSGRKLHVIKEEGPMSAMREDMRRRRPQPPKRFLHRLFLADRSMSLGLGISTMTATWVGGGYLNGTAEAVYTHGVLYCHVPIGYAISLVLGGCFFAQKMRTTNAVTMLDPFQEQYGRWMGLLLCLPAVCGEMFWTAAMLAALGDAAGSMMEVDSKLFIVIAATTIFFYTALGGQYSVAYTDVLQICITIVFMWVCVPYVMKGRAVGTVRGPETDWIGDVSFSEAGPLLDAFLMTALGGIPWQVYFQCILGSNSDFAAEVLSYVSALGCVVMAVPPIVIGATAKTTSFRDGGGLNAAHHGVPVRRRGHLPGAVGAVGVRTVDTVLRGGVRTALPAARVRLLHQEHQHLRLRHSVRAGRLRALAVRRAFAERVGVDTAATVRSKEGTVVSFPTGMYVDRFRRTDRGLLGSRHGFREAVASATLRRIRLLPRTSTRRDRHPTHRHPLDQGTRRGRALRQDMHGLRQVGAEQQERADSAAFEEIARDEHERDRAVHEDRSQQGAGVGVEPSPQTTQPGRQFVGGARKDARDDQQQGRPHRQKAEAAQHEAGWRRRDGAYHEECRDVGLLAARQKAPEELVAAGELDRTSGCIVPSWTYLVPAR
ncbi:high-affinity choline transporter 1 [Rhipicephalus sanguineus]|uniref:high-affinity choline transporter 1 n=1 Tax=Rhipicephalus sanguineus TaxID=34632 RepID=UPI0020C1C91A|nr:high-affinity choline transporter 1 [Rhipicephalus sanguineus]